MSVLQNLAVREQLWRAWIESYPGQKGGHEEGGFVLRQVDGSLTVERWPRGAQDEIKVPEHSGGRRGAAVVVASFHTHPNTGADYLQEPSPSDIRGVVEDPDLRHPEYEGEYVISEETVYRVDPDGLVHALGVAASLLSPLPEAQPRPHQSEGKT
jgi:hypothetical protein